MERLTHDQERDKQALQRERMDHDNEVARLRDTVGELKLQLARAEASGKCAVKPSDLAAKADGKVQPKELVNVAERVADTWESLASKLSPEFFSVGKVTEIEQTHPRKRAVQARAMLEQWANKCASKATCCAIIQALCQAGHKRQAQEVFGEDLVEFVESH